MAFISLLLMSKVCGSGGKKAFHMSVNQVIANAKRRHGQTSDNFTKFSKKINEPSYKKQG
jgi:hypothetical protein